MYPRISDLTRDLFGFDFPIDLYAFGLMVAIGILVATAMTRVEVDRRYALGWMKSVHVLRWLPSRSNSCTRWFSRSAT